MSSTPVTYFLPNEFIVDLDRLLKHFSGVTVQYEPTAYVNGAMAQTRLYVKGIISCFHSDKLFCFWTISTK